MKRSEIKGKYQSFFQQLKDGIANDPFKAVIIAFVVGLAAGAMHRLVLPLVILAVVALIVLWFTSQDDEDKKGNEEDEAPPEKETDSGGDESSSAE